MPRHCLKEFLPIWERSDNVKAQVSYEPTSGLLQYDGPVGEEISAKGIPGRVANVVADHNDLLPQ